MSRLIRTFKGQVAIDNYRGAILGFLRTTFRGRYVTDADCYGASRKSHVRRTFLPHVEVNPSFLSKLA